VASGVGTKSTRVAVIMAGGSGERFWPLSREKRPKQLLPLASEKATLLEEAIGRVSSLIDPEHVYISTSRTLAGPIRKAKLGIPAENVLAEPCKRNTAGCLSWVAGELLARHGDENVAMAVLTSDHKIEPAGKFRACVKAALTAAEKHDALVTIGIKPTRAETGYGYIELEKQAAPRTVAPVVRFREKPNPELAQEFLESGRHYWNSGMFFWRIGTFLREMADASPVHGDAMLRIAESLKKGNKTAAARAFESLPNISIDYALMEKSPNVTMVAGDFFWDDVGAWDAIERSRRCDEHHNVCEGGAVVIDTRNSIVINEAGQKVSVGVLGMENVVVIVSGDAVLVVPKDRAQDVRQVVRELKSRGSRHV
jgi:mannose-1-phosphate guanylyltransferase